jgi:hypothetical protein
MPLASASGGRGGRGHSPHKPRSSRAHRSTRDTISGASRRVMRCRHGTRDVASAVRPVSAPHHAKGMLRRARGDQGLEVAPKRAAPSPGGLRPPPSPASISGLPEIDFIVAQVGQARLAMGEGGRRQRLASRHTLPFSRFVRTRSLGAVRPEFRKGRRGRSERRAPTARALSERYSFQEAAGPSAQTSRARCLWPARLTRSRVASRNRPRR